MHQHPLLNNQTAADAGSQFDVWRLGDQTAAGSKFASMAIPYDFDSGDWAVVEDHGQGLDYAAVHLRTLYRLQLEAGGVVPFKRHAWSDHVTPADHWGLAGIPKESVKYDGRTMISARIVFVKIVPQEDPPPDAGMRAENKFYAKLIEGSEEAVSDIDGMSGGPVVKILHKKGKWHYWVIGVQSGWYRSSRIVAVCPFSSFGLALEKSVAPVLSALGRCG